MRKFSIILFCCVALCSALSASVYAVDYTQVTLDGDVATYVAIPLHSQSGNQGKQSSPLSGAMGQSSPSFSFGSTSMYIADRGASCMVLNEGNTSGVASKRRVSPDRPPKDPFVPVGDVPFALMLLLCGVWMWLRRRKTT